MSLILNRAEYELLTAFRQQGLEAPADAVGSWTGAYSYLVNLIHAQPNSGADSKSVAWLKGAVYVNGDNGAAAEFIRQYTRQQYRIRYGQELSDAQLQTASNSIAEAVFASLYDSVTDLGNGLYSLDVPAIAVIAEKDAGRIAAEIFSGNRQGWAGDPLFVSLNFDTPFREDMLPLDSHGEYSGDIYNLLAMIDSLGTTASLLNWQENIHNFWSLVDNTINLGSLATVQAAASDAITYFNRTYGTGDGSLLFLQVLGANIKVGKLNGSNLVGTTGKDILCGGQSIDSFQYSPGYDLMDGGIGAPNVADFSNCTLSATVLLGEPGVVSIAEWLGRAVFGSVGIDAAYMYNIRTVTGTPQGDNFLVYSDVRDRIFLFGGSGVDTLSAFYATQSIYFNDSLNILTVGTKNISYQDFEVLDGSTLNDTFRINRGGKTLRGDAGNDRFQIANYTADLNGAVLDGGAGANVIETGDYADISGATLTNLQTLQVNSPYGLVLMRVAQLNGFSAINAVGGNAVIGLTTGGTYNLSNLSLTGAITLQALTTEALTATGTSGDDTMSGWSSDDATLYGVDGNDTMIAGTGRSRLYGGNGDDYLVMLSGPRSLGDILDGGAGNNTLDVAAHTDLSVMTLRNLQKLTVEGEASLTAAQFNLFVQYMAYGGSATLQAKTAGTYNLSGKTTSGRISLKGSAGSDVLVGDTKAQTLDGSAGVDQLTGGGGADIFKFSALTDSQYPGAMDLITDFTIGTDKIDVTGLGFTGLTAGTAGTGQLKLRYDSYYNFTYVYDTGTGFGFYMAGNKSALTAADFIGLPPSATVTISGTAGNDVLTGSDANDMLLGYAGADQLIGNSGNDVLDGGAGVDQLTGGAGLDVFRFTMLADSIFASDMDRIADFVKGEDKIDLTGLGFTGVTTGTPTAGQLKLSFDAYYNQTYLRDLNGSGFGFYMTGNQTTITNSDMIGLV